MNAFLPLNTIQNIINEGYSIDDIDSVIEIIVNDPDFESSEIEIETYDSIEELKFPNEYDGGIIILDDLNQKEMEDPRIQAMFQRSRHNNLSIYIISQDYFELPKRTIRTNGNIYHIFKPNKFRDVQNLYQWTKLQWI